jgi:chromate reductase, NAD(P)H dehydrogenase (quinone)
MTTRLLLISGSLRIPSTNTALLATAARYAPAGCVCRLYRGLATLAPFRPELEGALPASADDLRSAVREADALVFSTPEYAGALPGAFKNLLDWLIGDEDPRSVYGKPVAWLNASTRGAAGAHDELRRVLAYAGAHLVEQACATFPVTNEMIGTDGVVEGVEAIALVQRTLSILVDACYQPPSAGAST